MLLLRPVENNAGVVMNSEVFKRLVGLLPMPSTCEKVEAYEIIDLKCAFLKVVLFIT